MYYRKGKKLSNCFGKYFDRRFGAAAEVVEAEGIVAKVAAIAAVQVQLEFPIGISSIITNQLYRSITTSNPLE